MKGLISSLLSSKVCFPSTNVISFSGDFLHLKVIYILHSTLRLPNNKLLLLRTPTATATATATATMTPPPINDTNRDACNAMVMVVRTIQDIAECYQVTRDLKDLYQLLVQHLRQTIRQLKQDLAKDDPRVAKMANTVKAINKLVAIKVEHLKVIKENSIAFRTNIKGTWEPKALQNFVGENYVVRTAMNLSFEKRENDVHESMDSDAFETALMELSRVKMVIEPAELARFVTLASNLRKAGVLPKFMGVRAYTF